MIPDLISQHTIHNEGTVMAKMILKEIFRILIGFINLFVFWGVRGNGNIYSFWGGINTSGNVYSLVGFFQYASGDAEAFVGVLQCARGSIFALIGFFQWADYATDGFFIGLIQRAGTSATALITIYQWSKGESSSVISIV